MLIYLHFIEGRKYLNPLAIKTVISKRRCQMFVLLVSRFLHISGILVHCSLQMTSKSLKFGGLCLATLNLTDWATP